MSSEIELRISIPSSELEQFFDEFDDFHYSKASLQFVDNSPNESELNLKWLPYEGVYPHREAIDFLIKHRSVSAFRKENCTFWIYLVIDNIEQGNFEWSSDELMELGQFVRTLCLCVTSIGKDYTLIGRLPEA